MKNFKQIAIYIVIALALFVCAGYAWTTADKFITMTYTGQCNFYEFWAYGMDAFDKVYHYGIGFYICIVVYGVSLVAGIVTAVCGIWKAVELINTKSETNHNEDEI